MTDHYTSALSKSSANVHLFPTHEENTYVNLNGQFFKERQYHNQNTCNETIIINPSTTVPTNVFDSVGNFVDIYLDTDGKIHKLRDIFAQFDLTNTSGSTALSPPPSDFMITRYETFIGERSLGTTSAICNYLAEKAFMNYDELVTAASAYNINPITYAETSSTIAAAGTRTCRINLLGPLRGTGIFLPGLEQKIRIQIYFEAAATWAVSASPTVSVANFKIICEHTKLNKKNYEHEFAMFRNMGVRLKYMDLRYTKHAASNTANVESNQRLSNVSGLSSTVFIFARAANPTGSGAYALKTLDNIYITDGSTNMVGGSSLKGEYLRFKSYKQLPSRICYYLAVYPIFFAENLHETYFNATNTGYLPLNENSILYWTPSATASDQIEIMSLHYNTVYIKGSTIVIEKSL